MSIERALINVTANDTAARVPSVPRTGERSNNIRTRRLATKAVVRQKRAFVFVCTRGTITSVAQVARASERTDTFGAHGISVAVMEAAGAFIDARARCTVASVPQVTGTSERAWNIGARSVGVATMQAAGALVRLCA
jgi:hypothetical protein